MDPCSSPGLPHLVLTNTIFNLLFALRCYITLIILHCLRNKGLTLHNVAPTGITSPISHHFLPSQGLYALDARNIDPDPQDTHICIIIIIFG